MHFYIFYSEYNEHKYTQAKINQWTRILKSNLKSEIKIGTDLFLKQFSRKGLHTHTHVLDYLSVRLCVLSIAITYLHTQQQMSVALT